jgi:hypothetical protein
MNQWDMGTALGMGVRHKAAPTQKKQITQSVKKDHVAEVSLLLSRLKIG